MSILDESIEDLNGRYRNAFFLATIAGVERLVWPHEYNQQGGKKCINLRWIKTPEESKQKWATFSDENPTLLLEGLEFKEWYPQRGLYNPDKRCRDVCSSQMCWIPTLLVFRSTARQWHHGLGQRTVNLRPLFGKLLNDYILDPMSRVLFHQEPSFAYALWKPTYPTYEKGLEIAETSVGGCAISPTLGLFANPNGSGVLLHRLGHFIGLATKKTLEVKDSLFAQEVKDFSVRNQVNLQVAIG